MLQTNTLERRLFYIPSFKIYGSVAGFYDYGPPGCAIKQNLTQVRVGDGGVVEVSGGGGEGEG
jgi:glycyl-tRNA synthetase (class II)